MGKPCPNPLGARQCQCCLFKQILFLIFMQNIGPGKRVSAQERGGGGGGGGTLIFSSYHGRVYCTIHLCSYVGSGPASTIHPQKYQVFQASQNNI